MFSQGGSSAVDGLARRRPGSDKAEYREVKLVNSPSQAMGRVSLCQVPSEIVLTSVFVTVDKQGFCLD